MTDLPPPPPPPPVPPPPRPPAPPQGRDSSLARRARGCLVVFLVLSALLWSGRGYVLPFVVSHLARWESLPPADASRERDIDHAIDLLSQFDVRGQVQGRAHLEQAGSLAVPQLVNRMGVEKGMRRLGLPGRLTLAGDPTPLLRAALVALTFQDFGEDAHAWARWWNEWKEDDRDEWALAALQSGREEEARRGLDWFSRRRESSPRVLLACLEILRGNDAGMRAEAYEHLVGCANQDFGYDPARPADEQPDAVASIERWVALSAGPREDLIPAER